MTPIPANDLTQDIKNMFLATINTLIPLIYMAVHIQMLTHAQVPDLTHNWIFVLHRDPVKKAVGGKWGEFM